MYHTSKYLLTALVFRCLTWAHITNMSTVSKPTVNAVKPLVDVLEGKLDNEAGELLDASGVLPW